MHSTTPKPLHDSELCLMLVLFFFFLGSVTEALPWSTRVQIALDSARGLEYIHEHTVPVYIHRDIKCANILIDINFRAKVVFLDMHALLSEHQRGVWLSL